jgi:hypothetical protein
VLLPATPSPELLSIEFLYRPPPLVEGKDLGPYAAIQLDGVTPAGAPLQRLISWIADVAIGITLMGAVFVAARPVSRRALGVAGLSVSVSLAVVAVDRFGRQWLIPDRLREQVSFTSVFALAVTMACVLLFRRLALWVGGAALFTTVVVEVLSRVQNFETVLFRSRGDDWMTYQAFAREMLAGNPLRGAEDVFYYQPGYRYVLFVLRLLFGDGDAAVAIALIASFVIGALVLAQRALLRNTS